MSELPRRRDILGAGIAGAAAASTWSCSQQRSSVPIPPDGLPSLQQMADEVIRCKRGDLMGIAGGWVREGASTRDLLGAALLAGVHEVNPSPIGGQVHAMMMVQSASCMSGHLRGRDALLPAMFNLDRVKNSQARDRRRGDWTMPAAPAVDTAPTETLGRDFERALEQWNKGEADRLAVALHRHLSLDEFFEHVWWSAVRDYRVIGHKAIYAAQAHRALKDLGWRYGRDVARSVLFGVLDQNPYDSTTDEEARSILALLPHNKDRASRLPDRHFAADAAVSRELCAAMRAKSSEQAADEVVTAIGSGASEATCWDAVRLRAFEQTRRLPTIAGVHPVTTTNALHYIADTTQQPLLRRVCLLQGASWMSLFEDLVRARGSSDRNELRIETIKPGDAGDPFTAGSELERTARIARQLTDDPSTDAFGPQVAAVLAKKAEHDHNYKFAAAVVEEVAAASPAVRPLLAGCAMSYLHHAGDDDNRLYQTAIDALPS